MNKVLEFFKDESKEQIIEKNIRVYGWQNEYEHLLRTSISKYLFEDLVINENICPVNEVNRPGRIKEKKYITVHDTGDADPLHTAKFWSTTVFNHSWEQYKGTISQYACSYQYVVDNEGIYHNIPDNEVAYHAGDGTMFEYKLYKTGIKSNNSKAKVTISLDGYYEVNGEKSCLLAPRYHIEKEGKVIEDRIATSEDINDEGVLCKLIEGEYYIGETYFSQGYKKIANRGGNNNSIGIESCITADTDIYYTWQKTAKLVAYLMEQNNLSIEDVKQHHYFSAKNCPQTMRMNGMWEHVKELIKFEYQIIQFKKEGYEIELIINDERVNKNGRIINSDNKENISYTIKVKKDGKVEEIELSKSF